LQLLYLLDSMRSWQPFWGKRGLLEPFLCFGHVSTVHQTLHLGWCYP
jgi:hypothetical protein